MEQRRKEGHVRECHGDIHLGNMARLEGQLTLFDGIEFNDSFRWIDSCADIAFLIMDLHDRKRADLANCVLDRYLEESGDQAALALLRYYLSYRAMVRAKVACFRLGQTGLDDTAREQVIATFRSYLGLAERQAKPPRPWLAITHGLSASGKSHIAGELVRAAGAIRLRSDVERKRLFGLEADARTGSPLAGGLYSSDASARTYRRLEELAEQILLAGYPVVVDATFLHLAGRQQFRALAERLKVPFHLLAIDCSEELLRKRITSRRDDPSEATLAVLESQIASREPVSEAESGTIRIDGAAPDIDQLLATINPESRE
jgi:predicted kinase